MKIGFIGLGTMGRHMASNLIKAGPELVVHDVRPEASAPHRQGGAEARSLALGAGGGETVFDRFKPVLDAIGDQPYYVGPIGAGSIAKLVHNCAGYVIQTALAEVFTMGVKAGVEPLALWKAVRQGAGGRRRTFDGLVDQFLPGRFEPPALPPRLAHQDVTLATALGREHKVPMKLANITLEEMTEALNRG